jgi:hypothetical protein
VSHAEEARDRVRPVPGHPDFRSGTQTSITNTVCDLLIKMRVELVLVDEIPTNAS